VTAEDTCQNTGSKIVSTSCKRYLSSCTTSTSFSTGAKAALKVSRISSSTFVWLLGNIQLAPHACRPGFYVLDGGENNGGLQMISQRNRSHCILKTESNVLDPFKDFRDLLPIAKPPQTLRFRVADIILSGLRGIEEAL